MSLQAKEVEQLYLLHLVYDDSIPLDMRYNIYQGKVEEFKLLKECNKSTTELTYDPEGVLTIFCEDGYVVF